MLQSSLRALSRSCSRRSLYTLPELPYSYDALEPVVNREIMEIHHSKHHNTYVTNLNNAVPKLETAVEAKDISTVMACQRDMVFNAGGHINHSIFWNNLSPNGGGVPDGALGDAISSTFSSFDKFKAELSAAAIGVQGSGWAWLGVDPNTKRLGIAKCANQDPLLATTGLVPLLGFDVWEHAYYLQYKNVRPEYVGKIWDIVNWEDVAERYQAVLGK